MLRKLLIAPLMVGLVSLGACTSPPISSPQTKFRVTIGDLYPSITEGLPVVVPPVENYRGPVITIPVPNEARQFNISTALLNLSATNNTQVPLKLNFYLAPQDPYQPSALLGSLDVAVGQSARFQKAMDTSLFKNATLQAGMELSTPGSSGSLITVNKADNIEFITWVTAQAKLI